MCYKCIFYTLPIFIGTKTSMIYSEALSIQKRYPTASRNKKVKNRKKIVKIPY